MSPSVGGELAPADRPIAEAIDHYVDQGLASAGVVAAPEADDANLIRRLTFDLAGRPPTAYEARAYCASAETDKRARLVDRLLESSEFLAHQVNEFDALLMPSASGNLREYLTKALQARWGWDRVFRELIAGHSDAADVQGADEFLKSRVKDSDRLTNDVSTLFFGVNISCTQCHDHPLVSDWKQDHFYGLKSFFNRTFENGGFLAERDYGVVAFKTPKGEDRTASLMFISGVKLEEPAAPELTNDEKKEETRQLKQWAKDKVAPPAPKFSRRAQLADIALQPGERHFFAASIVNRLWYRLIGRGLVTPVDQMHSENPPSHPELLQWLARDLIEHGYDLRRLMRGVALSRVYSRSSRWDSVSRPAPELFAVANPRPLTPLQFAAALRLATTDPERFATAEDAAEVARRIESQVSGSRGLAELFDMPVDNFQISASEPLRFSNDGRVASELLAADGGHLLGRLNQLSATDERIDTAVWSILSRPPTAGERQALGEFLAARTDRAAPALEQMVWALLTSAEFRFNH